MTGRPRTVGGPPREGRAGQQLLPTILLVDSDADAGAMVRDAMLEGTGPLELRTVATATELADYLDQRPMPTLVLVDLDDEEALPAIERLKQDPTTRRIPVVALTKSRDDAHIARGYDAGANTVLPRPVTFLALVRLMKVVTAYWLDAAALPA
jgi:two-component system response regulator